MTSIKLKEDEGALSPIVIELNGEAENALHHLVGDVFDKSAVTSRLYSLTNHLAYVSQTALEAQSENNIYPDCHVSGDARESVKVLDDIFNIFNNITVSYY